jgi:predicted DNA-binding transcriptional regulator AlpA
MCGFSLVGPCRGAPLSGVLDTHGAPEIVEWSTRFGWCVFINGGLGMSLEHSPGRYSDFDSVRIIRDGDMPDIIGTSRSSWLRMKQGGDCPPAIRLSVRQVGYRLSDVKVWLDKKQGA